MPFESIEALNQVIINCERCPRLREYCNQIGLVKRKAYRDQVYWTKPVPGFGDPQARILIVGLAPGAHGSNRTGRMFTGDRSGDFLYAALYRAGLCSQPETIAPGDGLTLNGVYITAVCRCAPPGNKPQPDEQENCRPYLEAELDLLVNVETILCLGKIAFDQMLRLLPARGQLWNGPRPAFGHGVEYQVGKYNLAASYHPSQQNTQTGRLTVAMMDRILQELLLRRTRSTQILVE